MTELQGRTASLLHQQALKIARELEHQEFLMIEVLQRIDHEKAYGVLGFRSLFEYTTVALKLGRIGLTTSFKWREKQSKSTSSRLP